MTVTLKGKNFKPSVGQLVPADPWCDPRPSSTSPVNAAYTPQTGKRPANYGGWWCDATPRGADGKKTRGTI